VAALALIAAASFTSSAMAASLGSTGDVILGVYDSNSTTIPSYEVDLGNISTLTAGETFNLGTTLASNFSGDTSANLVFNIFSAPSSTTYALLSTSAITPASGSSGTQPITYVNNIYNDQGSTAVTLPSTMSSNGTAIAAATSGDSDSFYSQGGSASPALGAVGATNPTLSSSGASSVITFYGVTVGAHSASQTVDGTFQFGTVSGNEILTFDPTATPEPSAYALGLCTVVLFWVLKRRRSIA
jgi:hypothetical protein